MTNTNAGVIWRGIIEAVAFGHYKFRPDRLKNRELVIVVDSVVPPVVSLKAINGTLAHHAGFLNQTGAGRVIEAKGRGERLYALVDGMDTSPNGVGIPIVTIRTLQSAEDRQRERKRLAGRSKLKVLNPPGTRRILT